VDYISPIMLTASLAVIGYFMKKRFDKLDTICKNVMRLESAIYQIPCVKTFLDKEKHRG
jgi:hypothetical protein